MKKKLIKNVYQVASIIIFVIGIFFTYLIAELDDAPGFIFFGSGVSVLVCLLLFGLGSLIDITRSNNRVLTDIYEEIRKKK